MLLGSVLLFVGTPLTAWGIGHRGAIRIWLRVFFAVLGALWIVANLLPLSRWLDPLTVAFVLATLTAIVVRWGGSILGTYAPEARRYVRDAQRRPRGVPVVPVVTPRFWQRLNPFVVVPMGVAVIAGGWGVVGPGAAHPVNYAAATAFGTRYFETARQADEATLALYGPVFWQTVTHPEFEDFLRKRRATFGEVQGAELTSQSIAPVSGTQYWPDSTSHVVCFTLAYHVTYQSAARDERLFVCPDGPAGTLVVEGHAMLPTSADQQPLQWGVVPVEKKIGA